MASLGIRSHCEQLVADAANGDEPLRRAGGRLDLPPQVGDVDVAGALVADVRRVPEVLHDLAAAVDPLGLLREEGEETELRGREPDRLPVDPYLVPVDVELERSDAADGAPRGAVELAAAQDRAQTAHELGDRERLRHVVVGAGLEAEHAVDLRVHRRQDQDRDVALAAQAAADLDPGEAGEADVEDEDVVALRPRRLQGGLAVAEGVDLEAGGTQRVADGVGDRRLVVDDQDSVAHVARTRAARSPRRTVVPFRGADSISSSEPIASAAAATIASPSPNPPDASSSPR